jgi:hypothetical protein
MTLSDEPQATTPAFADNDPTETIVIAMPPPPPRPHHDRPISQTTEHLLIAAGSIGKMNRVHMLDYVLTSSRSDYHHRYGSSCDVHYAKARSYFQGCTPAGQATTSPWAPTPTTFEIRSGQEAEL